MASSSSSTAMGDFGGDYGNYLRLLEGDTALGFNPQSDPIGENQVQILTLFLIFPYFVKVQFVHNLFNFNP